MKASEIKNAVREPQSEVEIVPMGNKFIIKAEFKVSPLMLMDEKKLNECTPNSLKIAGYGELTSGYELGDKVIVNGSRAIMRLDIKNNDKSIYSYLQKAKNKTLIQGTGIKYDIVEYYLYDGIDILGYIKPDIANA